MQRQCEAAKREGHLQGGNEDSTTQGTNVGARNDPEDCHQQVRPNRVCTLFLSLLSMCYNFLCRLTSHIPTLHGREYVRRCVCLLMSVCHSSTSEHSLAQNCIYFGKCLMCFIIETSLRGPGGPSCNASIVITSSVINIEQQRPPSGHTVRREV